MLDCSFNANCVCMVVYLLLLSISSPSTHSNGVTIPPTGKTRWRCRSKLTGRLEHVLPFRVACITSSSFCSSFDRKIWRRTMQRQQSDGGFSKSHRHVQYTEAEESALFTAWTYFRSLIFFRWRHHSLATRDKLKFLHIHFIDDPTRLDSTRLDRMLLGSPAGYCDGRAGRRRDLPASFGGDADRSADNEKRGFIKRQFHRRRHHSSLGRGHGRTTGSRRNGENWPNCMTRRWTRCWQRQANETETCFWWRLPSATDEDAAQ